MPEVLIGHIRRAHGLLTLVAVISLTFSSAAPPSSYSVRAAEANGIGRFLSRVTPFGGIIVGLRHRNRVYRSSERFIRDRNQYYDGLRETARQQLLNREIVTLRKSQVAAYVKLVNMIEHERSVTHEVAETRKREARQAFHRRLENAVLYAISGTRLAQDLFTAVRQGIGSAQDLLKHAANSLSEGQVGILGDLNRVRRVASSMSQIAGVIGGRTGSRLQRLSQRIIRSMDAPQMAAGQIIASIQLDLAEIDGVVFELSQRGRAPSAGDIKEALGISHLPRGGEGGAGGEIAIDAIVTILSKLDVRGGSISEEARAKLQAGLVARCALASKAFQEQLAAMRNPNASSGSSEETCDDLDGLLDFEEDVEESKSEGQPHPSAPETPPEPTATDTPPIVTASGQFPEALTGNTNTSPPLGTQFELTADLNKRTISGTLNGGRTSTGLEVQCVDPEDSSVVVEVALANYTDAYTASFSGGLDPDSGDFSLTIKPQGNTTAIYAQPFAHPDCSHLNSQSPPGATGWAGEGTVSGYVTRDGSIELTTSWTSFGTTIGVTGSWSGSGSVTPP